MSRNYVPNPKTLPVTYTKLVSNQNDEDIQTGRTKPTLITAESPQSIQLVVDGKTRLGQNETPSSFRVSMNSNLFRARMARVSKVVIPKPPNVTQFNNRIVFTVWDTVTTQPLTFFANLPVGFYDTTSLANALAAAMNAVASVVPFSFSVNFISISRNFEVVSSTSDKFYFHSECPFIARGLFLMNLPSFPAGSDPNVVGTPTVTGGIAGMVYTRYAIISSESMNQYSFSDSRSTTLLQKTDVICIVDLTSLYTPEDFDQGSQYGGALYSTIDTPEAPHIMVTNPQRNMNDKIDIRVQDEYGSDYNDLLELGAPSPPNSLGISLWMEVTF
jgi:hypothetical protein